MKIEAVDIFCGVGGLSYGLRAAHIKVVAGFDNDPNCRYAYERNTGAEFHLRDIRDVTAKEVAGYFSGTSQRLIAGCAPCQKYSDLTNKQGQRHGRWRLIKKFSDIVLTVKPEHVTMENVPNVQTVKEFQTFVKDLRSAGYSVWHDVINCEQFGVPQRRRRLVMIASLVCGVSPLQGNESMVSVKNAIGKLPELNAGDICEHDFLHRSANLSPVNLQRIRHSRPGGNWKDWPEALRLDCHSSESGSSYTSVYGRMSWDGTAPTITTRACNYGSGRFGHPEQDRCISIREAAMLQSFPDDYEFFADAESITFLKAGKLIGNAVPPKLAESIGRHIVQSAPANGKG